MKTNKIITLILALVVGISFNSCVEDGDYTVPQGLGLEENSEVEKIIAQLNDQNGTLDPISIKNLKGLAIAGEATEITSDLVVKGYVTSSDRTGNFFKEIFIQNSAEDPEAAIKIVLNLNDTYNKYNLGREVYIKLNGLFIGETRVGDGVITIGGIATGDVIDDVSIKQISENIFRSSVTKTLVPKTMKLSEVSEDNIGMYIKIENAQFLRDIKDLTFGDPDEQFDTQRRLESCSEDGAGISLETSSFSTFKFSPLPSKSFSINSVVSKTFNGSDLILVLNDKNEITETGERCDPDFLECTGTTSTTKVIFEEDFQSITNESQLDGMGWTNVNVSGGSERYERNVFSGDTYLKISAFGTNESPLNAWLVTPVINLDSSTNEELSFEISSNFETGKVLEAYITENYTGDPTTTEWKLLNANVPTGDGGFGSFVQSKINISCLNGDVHVGFKYFGADGGAETRYHLDDIKVTGD